MFRFTSSSQALPRRVVLWLALIAWGIALASPSMPVRGMTEICTSHGVVWISADEAPGEWPVLALDCDLCLPAALPAPAPFPAFTEGRSFQALPPFAGLNPSPFAEAMPPPARGPPRFPIQTQEVPS